MNNNILKSFCVKVFERGLAISSYIFPIIEISYSFGPKVFSGTNNIFLNYCYFNYIAKLNVIYTNNVYLIFVLMVGIFMVCSRGTLPLSQILRYNIIQAILLNILCSCVGSSFAYFPVAIRESLIGNLISNCMYLGTMGLVLYAATLIIFGGYPRIPVLSEAARLQVQRGYLD